MNIFYEINLNVILYIFIIDCLAIISPGPDFFMVVKNSVNATYKAGMYTAFGIVLGSVIMFTAGIFGVAALVINNAILFKIFKFIGAGYLFYIATKSLLSIFKQDPNNKSDIMDTTNTTEANSNHHSNQYSNQESSKIASTPLIATKYIISGLICNLTNPKALLFLLALSTYLLEHGDPSSDGIIIIILCNLFALIWFLIVAKIFSNKKITFMTFRAFISKDRIELSSF